MTPEEYVDQLGAFECFAENEPGHDFRPGFCRTCLINQFAEAIRAERERAEKAEAERDEALAQLREERAVCICGCPEESHDSLGEDGEACDDVTHECMRVAAGIGAAFVETRNRAEKAEAEVAKLLAERDADRPHEARWQEEHSYHTRVMARHEAAIAALRAENAKLRETLNEVVMALVNQDMCNYTAVAVIRKASAALAECEEPKP